VTERQADDEQDREDPRHEDQCAQIPWPSGLQGRIPIWVTGARSMGASVAATPAKREGILQIVERPIDFALAGRLDAGAMRGLDAGAGRGLDAGARSGPDAGARPEPLPRAQEDDDDQSHEDGREEKRPDEVARSNMHGR
jgi:hypothetical protein